MFIFYKTRKKYLDFNFISVSFSCYEQSLYNFKHLIKNYALYCKYYNIKLRYKVYVSDVYITI